MKVYVFLFYICACFLYSEEAKIFSPSQTQYEVLGLGGALTDYFLEVDEQKLNDLHLKKGGWKESSLEEIQIITSKNPQKVQISYGGSTVNVIKGLAHLGRKCGIIGKIGNDDLGKNFTESLQKKKIKALFYEQDLPTGRVLCLITPDGERTMLVYPGASYSPFTISVQPFHLENVLLFHVEGYEILDFDLLKSAMLIAKEKRAVISMNLGNFQIVEKHRKKFLYILENYVDIVFANQEEAKAISSGMSPMDACSYLAKICDFSIVNMGAGGGWIKKGKKQFYFPSIKATIKDSTGAGDFFSAGFLHGYLKGYALEKCAWMGAYMASKVIEVTGAEINEVVWDKILTRFRLEDEMSLASEAVAEDTL